RGAEVRDKGGKNPQVLRLFLGSCVLQQDANLGRAAGSGSTLGSAPTATLGGAHQVHRFATVAISDLSVGTFLKQIANEIHIARRRRHGKSRHAFVGGGRAGDAHGICLRTGDLSIDTRAVLKKHIHERDSLAAASCWSSCYPGSPALAAPNARRNQEW